LKKNFRLSSLLMLTALSLAGCGTAGLNLFHSTSATTMKKYSVNSSKSIGQTNPKDNAIIKKFITLQPDLPGINIQTVVLNLNTLGFNSSSDFLSTAGVYVYSGITSKVNGMYATYQCPWDSPTKVEQVEMDVTAPNGTSLSDFKALVEKDLGFLATLPYTGSKPVQAKQWVVNTIKTAKQPNSGFIKHQFGGLTEPKFGGVKFYLCPYTVQSNLPGQPEGLNAELFITYSTTGFPLAKGKG
jgi:hypothetical protein